MTEILILSALGLLLAPLFLRRRKLHPAERAKLQAASLVAGVIFLESALVLTAIPTLFDALGLADLAEACRRLTGPLLGSRPILGWTAFALGITFPLYGVAAWVRCRRRDCLYVAPWVGEHVPYGDMEVVVLPARALVAASVPGRPGQVLISRGVVETLSGPELDAVIRHEVAHLGHAGHLRLAVVLDQAVGWLPVVGRSIAALRLSLEQWADASVVREQGSPRPISDALRSYVFAALAPETAAFSTVESIRERLDALAAPPAKGRVKRAVSYALVVVPALVAGAALSTVVMHTEQLMAIGPYCPV